MKRSLDPWWQEQIFLVTRDNKISLFYYQSLSNLEERTQILIDSCFSRQYIYSEFCHKRKEEKNRRGIVVFITQITNSNKHKNNKYFKYGRLGQYFCGPLNYRGGWHGGDLPSQKIAKTITKTTWSFHTQTDSHTHKYILPFP